MKGSQARTERGHFRFTVKEHADGTPWITPDPSGGDIPMLKDAFLGFDLPVGANLDQAYKIADFMNRNLVNISMTVFDTHPLYQQK